MKQVNIRKICLFALCGSSRFADRMWRRRAGKEKATRTESGSDFLLIPLSSSGGRGTATSLYHGRRNSEPPSMCRMPAEMWRRKKADFVFY